MEIVIRKAEVYHEVQKITAQLAAYGLGADADFEAHLATEYDGTLLDTHWRESREAVLALFVPYVDQDTETASLVGYDAGETFTIKAKMPGRFDSRLTGSLANLLKLALAQGTASGWMLSRGAKEAAEQLEKAATAMLEEVGQILSYRMEPTATYEEEKEDDYEFQQYDERECHGGCYRLAGQGPCPNGY